MATKLFDMFTKNDKYVFKYVYFTPKYNIMYKYVNHFEKNLYLIMKQCNNKH